MSLSIYEVLVVIKDGYEQSSLIAERQIQHFQNLQQFTIFNKQTPSITMLDNNISASNKYPKGQPLHKYLTIDFRQDKATFDRYQLNKKHERNSKQTNVFFRTFYSKQTSKKYRKFQIKSSSGRQMAVKNRDSIIGTPLNLFQSNDPECPPFGLPSLEMSKYKHLLNTISGISKTKKLAQFNQSVQHSKPSKSLCLTPPSPTLESSEKKQMESPKVVNLKIGFEDLSNRNTKGECQNAFQKMFKNKQMLQKGRRHFVSRDDADEMIDFRFAAQQEFQVTQLPRHLPRPKRFIIL